MIVTLPLLAYTLDSMNKKIIARCRDCKIEWLKFACDFKKWQGRCRSCSKIGNTVASFNKGIPKSPSHRLAISKSRIGKIFSEEHRKNISKAKTGCKMHAEWCQRLSEMSRGANCHFYIDGRTPENSRIRHSLDYKNWRSEVFKRDNFTCQFCGQIGGELNADHIQPFALFSELRFDISNGRTLCVACHRKTETYGYKARKIIKESEIARISPTLQNVI